MQMLPPIYLLIPQLVSAAALGSRYQCQRAAYFVDNNPAGASIVVLKNSENGTPVRNATGGIGLFCFTASTTGAAPAPPGSDRIPTLLSFYSLFLLDTLSSGFYRGLQ
ncbi:hypothetical protein M430DRAFT_21897 [Amorphotheca resinae ATCC 22711]|uniref:Uncharacterized protein n=1 Tax=Amorphotheca resinae ATCC 22711 TaxID=857342 RepID=A0A2T3ASR5_AMORE|nr:hypothetical protein M430DRAFT_21897 [Amorphotheca resinae ATCC 22711]PSS10538.1 hypothetical protein M430DRAFT_21897 [Amorphotheca resinae ATCC 22711]